MSIGSELPGRANQVDGVSTHRGAASYWGDVIPYLLSSSDAVVIVASSLIGGSSYEWLSGYSIPDLFPYCAVGLLASFIHILRMSGSGYYELADSAKPRVEITGILVCWFTTGLLLAFFAFLLKVGIEFSRGGFVTFYLLSAVGLLGVRKLTKSLFVSAVARGGIVRPDVVLLGDYDEVMALERPDLLAFFGATEVSQFTLSRLVDRAARERADADVLDAVASFVRRNNCRELLLALRWDDGDRLEFVREHAKALPIAARLLPDRHVRSLTHYASSARQRVLAIEIQRAPLTAAERLVKRCMDLAVTLVALLPLVPILLLTAAAIKLDSPGPIIFRQQRKGFNGKCFVMLKFRTMKVLEDGPVVVQASREDPRVTSIGKLLRAASIDELPQLINVLKGDMSLVGPRPHALAHDDHFERLVGDYAFRHHVKPGITGWAQCNGARGATPTLDHIAERVRLDLWYINNWSLWLDVQILIKTFFEVLRRRNAY